MAIDINEHELVPEHELLEEDEVDGLLERFDITADQLPKMKRKDVMAKRLDAEPGDVVKITRDSATAGEATYYRLVVEE
jgi:DNA-directed RNA polymerase subunit H